MCACIRTRTKALTPRMRSPELVSHMNKGRVTLTMRPTKRLGWAGRLQYREVIVRVVDFVHQSETKVPSCARVCVMQGLCVWHAEQRESACVFVCACACACSCAYACQWSSHPSRCDTRSSSTCLSHVHPRVGTDTNHAHTHTDDTHVRTHGSCA